MRVIKLVVLIAIAVVPSLIFAQQRAQFTQYMNNNYVLNPAAGGTEDYVDVKMSFRKQWVDFSGSPETYYITAHSPIFKGRGKPNPVRDRQKSFHGLGGVLYDDVTGPTHRSAFQLSYTYNMALARKLRVSMGVLLGVQQFKLDAGKLDFPVNNEIVAQQIRMKPDGTIGVWLYNSGFFAGASMAQIFHNSLDLTMNKNNINDTGGVALPRSGTLSVLNYHFNLTGGLKIPLSHLVTFIPSIMFKYVAPTPVSIDLNAKLKYLDLYWVGMSYRNLESFSVLAGLTINNLIDIGYSYDAVVNGIGPYTMPGGSHEILVGIRLKPRGSVICPSNFW